MARRWTTPFIDILHTRFGTVGELIAVDGKAVCSTAKPGNLHSVQQIFSAYVTSSGVVLVQEAIHEKTNEISVFQEMLNYLDIEGKTVTADVMHCQRKTCHRVIQRKGDYLFRLKENQLSLSEDVRLFFESAGAEELDTFQTAEKNAGRIEKRICYKITDISCLKEHNCPGLQSIFSIERSIEVRGHFSRETSYYISSRDASAKKLMELAREHWRVEYIHWLLDITFSEDDSRLLCENANRTMNPLRKFALAVHKNFLDTFHLKSSIKANVLSVLLSLEALITILRFL